MLKNNFPTIAKLLILLSIVVLSSCQKVIDYDLKSASPQIVIEGELSDQQGLNYVRISKTVSYDETNTFPAVKDAIVTISDNAGNTQTLNEVEDGLYHLPSFKGIPGTNYILNVNAEGKQYQALSSMPVFVPIKEAYVDSVTFGSNTTKYVNVVVDDPVTTTNFYRVIEIINGDTLDVINISNDEFQEGKQITLPVFSDQDPGLKSGDSVELILQNIDKSTFDYFFQLSELLNSGSTSTAPGNPTSNFNNGALGYFSAYSFDTITIVVP